MPIPPFLLQTGVDVIKLFYVVIHMRGDGLIGPVLNRLGYKLLTWHVGFFALSQGNLTEGEGSVAYR